MMRRCQEGTSFKALADAFGISVAYHLAYDWAEGWHAAIKLSRATTFSHGVGDEIPSLETLQGSEG
jgi:hypothetical protein